MFRYYNFPALLSFQKVMCLPILAAPFASLLFGLSCSFHFYLPFVTCLPFSPLGLRPAFILSLNPGLVLRERCHGLSSHLARPRPDVMIEVPLNRCQPSEAIPHTFAMETPSWLMGSQKKAFQNWSSKWFSFSFFFKCIPQWRKKNRTISLKTASCHIILECLFCKVDFYSLKLQSWTSRKPGLLIRPGPLTQPILGSQLLCVYEFRVSGCVEFLSLKQKVRH